MKKVLFCLQTLTNGGVEKELFTILKLFPKNEFEITLLCFYESDEKASCAFKKLGIEIINLNIDKDYYCSSSASVIKSRIKKGKIIEAFKVLSLQGLKIGYTGSIISNKHIPNINNEFDIAVTYHMHSPIVVKYVAECVKAKEKYAWIHSDFSTSGYNPKRIKKYLSAYDIIVGCSKAVSNDLVKYLPEYINKVITIQNIVDYNEVIFKANLPIEDIKFSTDVFTILTIGRYVKEKGYIDAIQVCNELIKSGYDLKWYAIGWGTLEEELKQIIEKSGLKEQFILLGERINPYPYLKTCDLYVQPSVSEGFGLVISEAKALNKPIVSTDFAGAREQLKDHENGTIVPIGDTKQIKQAIIELMDNTDLRNKYIHNLSLEANNEGIEKILHLFR